MPRKSTTRAAQGAGTIRKKTVTRKGQEYTYWEARITVYWEANPAVYHRQDAKGSAGEITGRRRGDKPGHISDPQQNHSIGMDE